MKFGVLGCGSIGSRHIANIRALGHDALVYDPLLGAGLSLRSEVIRNSDAIVIASPTVYHFRDILDCIEERKPMLIEKPIIHPDEKKLALVSDALGTSGLPAFMAFNLRFHRAILKARELLPQIGLIFVANFVVAQKTTKPDYLRDGVISNWLSHELDVILWMFGPAYVAHSVVDDTDSIADIVLRHRDGSRTSAHANYHQHPEIRKFTICGTGGEIDANLVDGTVEIWTGDPLKPEGYRTGNNWDENYRDEMADFVEAVKGEPTNLASWEDGVNVARLVIQARQLGGL
jgi:predicted dehydrogenase